MNSVVSKVELIEKNGDRTIIDLSHIRLNETIRSDQFAIRQHVGDEGLSYDGSDSATFPLPNGGEDSVYCVY